jgi:hypothetical protein
VSQARTAGDPHRDVSTYVLFPHSRSIVFIIQDDTDF